MLQAPAQHCHRGDEAGEWRQRDNGVVVWRPTDAEAARAYQPPLSAGSTARHLVRALAGRRIVFVGDSMIRQVFTRLVCAVRELPVCVEPYSEFDMQLYQYRAAGDGGGGGGPPTDSYVYGVNARVAKDGRIGGGCGEAHGGWIRDGARRLHALCTLGGARRLRTLGDAVAQQCLARLAEDVHRLHLQNREP